jgi:cytoplasmic tRNA 2-thiolation protein 1
MRAALGAVAGSDMQAQGTFCGVFRRQVRDLVGPVRLSVTPHCVQALDRGAVLLGADKIVTGHNADDIAETVLMNCALPHARSASLARALPCPCSPCMRGLIFHAAAVLRGDIARLDRCVSIVTGADSKLSRCKPFKCGCGCGWPTRAHACVLWRVVIERGRRRRYTYEKEIVLYAHFCKLDYFSTECVYSPFAYRG